MVILTYEVEDKKNGEKFRNGERGKMRRKQGTKVENRRILVKKNCKLGKRRE